jgi:hypothetical protein
MALTAAAADPGLWQRYLLALQANPFLTKGLTGAFIKFFATLTAQQIRGVEKTDWQQVKQNCLFAMLDTPICHPWYNMGGLAALTNLVGLRPILKKSPTMGNFLQGALDQCTFGILYNSLFFVISGMVGGKTLQASFDEMTVQILPCTKASCGYWIPMMGVALAMPAELQMPTMSIIGFFWTVGLSILQKRTEEANKKKKGERGPKDQ